MDFANGLALLISVYAASLISPGPNFVIVTNTSMAVSRSAGLFAGLGLAFASLTWAVLSMAGLGFILAHLGWLNTLIQIAGALYLIWLGIKMIFGASKPIKEVKNAQVSKRSALWRGYIVSMTSPKSMAFFGSIFALVIPAHAPVWFYGMIAAICFIMSMAWYCGLALFFSNPRVVRQFSRSKKWIERTMGGMLIFIGSRLLCAR